MADVTGSANLYDNYLLKTFEGGTFLPETDVIKIGLAGSSYEPDYAAHVDLSNITDEISGNGYGRQTVTGVQIVKAGDWIKMTWDPVQFSASGGNFAPKFWFMFDDTVTNDLLIAGGQLNVNQEDAIVVVDGFSLDIVVNELGLYRIPV